MNLWRILVVDDDAGMLRSVERVLGGEYEIVSTLSSREAIELARTFKPDLAILDIQMPEMDGFQLMEQLQGLDPRLAVIFMTGSVHELDAKLIRAIRRNAFYFLQKPFDRGVLLSLVERCLELKRLDWSNRQHLQRMEKELADARAFQHSMLPPGAARLGGISIFAHYIPCAELAGDFYDYAALPPDGAVLLVADVSGHGVSAAMLTGVVKSAFHLASADAFEPVCVVERVANGIRSFGYQHFITMICARVRDDSLEFVNAGHPPGIVSNVRSTAAILQPTGPIISPALKCCWEQHAIPVTRGSDRLVLFTDGFLDAESEAGEYGLNRLVEEVGKRPTGDLLAEQIMTSVHRFAGGRPIEDDLTLVIADL